MTHDQSTAVRLREMKQELQSQKLELAYEKSTRGIDVTCEAEKLRQMRVKAMLCEDVNDDLQDQLAQDDTRFDELQNTQEELQNQLEVSTKDFERVRADLRLRDREIESLKTELRSLQGVSVDSSKLLGEKLALVRELSTLKPELEHLRAQVSSDQSLLSEKLSLQRQLSSLQVELETEKRASQRAAAKEEALQTEESTLKSEMQRLQTEIAKERKERQKAEREVEKASTEFESQKTVLESRLDAFRNKLRTTKEQLKEAQAEVQSKTIAHAKLTKARAESAVEATRNPRKRSMAQVEFDSTIGTPGVQAANKRGKRASSAIPGEKSNFSITPFLNRTASVAPDSPPSRAQTEEASENGNDTAAEEAANGEDASPSAKPKTAAAQRPIKPAALGVAKVGKANTRGRPKAVASRKASMTPALDQVTEEAEEVSQEIKTTRKAPTPLMKVIAEEEATIKDNTEPSFIKKKRKILGGASGLGKTLFDDEDIEATKGGGRGLFGGTKAIGALGRKGAPLGGVRLGPKPGAGAAGAFGTFSPLKKDRRAGSVAPGL